MMLRFFDSGADAAKLTLYFFSFLVHRQLRSVTNRWPMMLEAL